MRTIKTSLDHHGLGGFWDNPALTTTMGKEEWKDTVYAAVNASADSARTAVLSKKPSAAPYIDLNPTL